MRRFFSVALTFLLASTLLPTAVANVEDEQWKPPVVNAIPHHEVVFEEKISGLDVFPHLWAESKNGRFICTSTSDANCLSADHFVYTAIFPVCASDKSVDCVSSFKAVLPNGTEEEAVFKRYAVPNHINKFAANAQLEIPATESPGLWEFPTLTHNGGKTFVLDVGVNGFKCVQTDCSGEDKTLFGYVVPATVAPGASRWGYEKCEQQTKPTNGIPNTSCGISPITDVGIRCFLTLEENGDCMMRKAIPTGVRFKVATRLAKEPAAWIHGRMTEPNIEIKKLSDGSTSVVVEAAGTNVPSIYQGGLWQELSPAMKQFWTDCKSVGQSCGEVGAGDENGINYDAPHEKSRWTSSMLNYGTFAIGALNTVAKEVGDRANANPSIWSFHSLAAKQMTIASECFKKGSGVKGIVSTNATTYSEGPPSFTSGFLNYRVASPHYAPDGKTELRGTYNLVIRSDVARCLYGFSSAPVSATISVISSSGENQVATTIVNEKNGWLQLSANAFTYSSPTVKVKLSQGKSTITCVKGKTSKKVSAVNPKCPNGYKKK